jgi:predicted ribosomally synthesized peptide with SipW-like signal peptide
MRTRKYAALATTLALALMVVGAGVYASWSEQGTAVQSVEVGTFGMRIVAAAPGGEIAPDGKSVTYTVPEIIHSAASSAPFDFTVELVGEIPARVSAEATSPPDAPFFGLPLDPAGDTVLHQGEQVVFHGGIGWPELGMGDLGTATFITYTISASEGPPRASVLVPTTTAEPCGATSGGGITIPAVEGVDYFIAGAPAPAGFNGRPAGTYAVTAQAQAGYDPVLQGYPAGGWNLTVGKDCPAINTRTWNKTTNEVTIYVHTVPQVGGVNYTVQPGNRLAFFLTPGGWWPGFTGSLTTADASGNVYWRGTVPAGTTAIQVTVFDASNGLHTWYPTPWTG